MDYLTRPEYHYKPAKGWINDPNGLVYFKGYYHVFYQHSPNFEYPWQEFMYWGHARTRDFLHWEELPPALCPDTDYDDRGCWSGTATVKDGVLYLYYASVTGKTEQTISMAYSEDGISFTKYEGNPVIRDYPPEWSGDFRDPALCRAGDDYYCVIASGNPEARAARLLLYKSPDLKRWTYLGVMREWAEGRFTECPSFMPAGDTYLLTASVCPIEGDHYFSVMYGDFRDGKFDLRYSAEVDRGPDQYAGQVFRDHRGRNIMITWIPGWSYAKYAERDVGCLSVPRELKLEGGRITAWPVEEVRHLLKTSDPAVKRTDSGFIIERTGREPVVHEGEVRDLGIIRDGYIIEVFVNGGEQVYSALL
ncbi:MAG: glycoside hydrolase family 32 protein [Clostridia bacterium]|nr:glycoside hydrolase family 32 protein [Clostridia bacterium]